MLARRHRLTRSSDYSVVVRRGRRAGSRSLVCHLLVVPGEPRPARAGLVVGRAVGSAVMRNQVKRRLRHLLRERLASLPDSALLVVRALPASAGLGSGELAADLDRALGRLRREVA